MKRKEMIQVVADICSDHPGCYGCPYGRPRMGAIEERCELPTKDIIDDIYRYRKEQKKKNKK